LLFDSFSYVKLKKFSFFFFVCLNFEIIFDKLIAKLMIDFHSGQANKNVMIIKKIKKSLKKNSLKILYFNPFSIRLICSGTKKDENENFLFILKIFF